MMIKKLPIFLMLIIIIISFQIYADSLYKNNDIKEFNVKNNDEFTLYSDMCPEGCSEYSVKSAHISSELLIQGEGQTTKEISQFGVTWYFDREYEYGQFVNGDYWVIGPLSIVRITPETTEDPVMHGSMINPVMSSVQGYDDRSSWAKYNPQLNVAVGISSSNPLVIQAGNSLVSAISKPTGQDRPNLETAAVLTILDEVPPDGSFRPPYTDIDKDLKYNVNQLNFQLLQNLAPTESIPEPDSVIALFERPWIDHADSGVMAQFINPDLNIGGYGAVISPKTSLGLLMANTDISREQKERLVINMVQAGIDLYSLYMERAANRWTGGGGHNSGRLGLILFAGMMLQDEGMQNLSGAFQENDQTYYGDGWSGASVLWRGRSLHDFEYEEKHPSEWTVDGRGELGDPPSGSNSDMRVESYRQCCNAHTWVGTALAFRFMNGMKIWDHPAYFDYIDRWMTEDWSPYAEIIREETGRENYAPRQGATSHRFITEMWEKYFNNAPFVSVYPSGGFYSHPVEVKLDCEDTTAEIYYTLDGGEPTASSDRYSSPFIVNQNITLKTKAFLENGGESSVCTVEYQIEDQQPPEVENVYYDPDMSKIYICFNEKISEQGLENSSFSLSPDNSIIGVSLQEDRKIAILETTSLDISQKHILGITGIRDLMNPANIMEQKNYEINIHEIYEDDFEDETIQEWEFCSPERWVLQEDEGDTSLRLKSSYYCPDRKPGEYAILRDMDYIEFVLELEGKLTDPISDKYSDFCVIFGYQNNEDYYFIAFSRTNEAGIYKVDGETKYLLRSFSPITADNNYHKVEVHCINNEISVFVDDVLQGSIENIIQNGSIGFGTMNDPAMFDNFRVKKLKIREKAEEVSARPEIIEQPSSYTAVVGDDVTLSVSAAGYPEPEYQWQFNEEDIDGETFSTLIISDVQQEDEGSYRVVVNNSLGTEISESATLDVIEPLPNVLNLISDVEYYLAYLSWDNPSNQGDNWDKVLIVRKEDTPPTGPADGREVYNGTGNLFSERIINEGNYHYAVYTYKDFETNIVYSEPEIVEVSIPQFYNKKYLRLDTELGQSNERNIMIGQNTHGDLYTLWNIDNYVIGKGPGGNKTDLWLYIDLIGNNESQVLEGSQIVSARLVFPVKEFDFIDKTDNEITSVSVSNELAYNVDVYRITDPDKLGMPFFADESGIRVGLDYNYRDHRPGMNIPWLISEEEDISTNIVDLLKETEPVDTIEFSAGIFEDGGIKTLEFDVTEALQFWSDGDENQGLYITTGQGWNNGEALKLYGISAEEVEEQQEYGQSLRPYLEIVYGNSGDLTAPGSVENIEISTDTDSITLEWTNPSDSDFAGVKIVRKEGIIPFNHQDGEFVAFIKSTDETNNSYTDLGLTTGKTYYYALYAYDEEHNYSGKIWIKGTPGSPEAPTFIGEPTISNGSVTLNWNTVSEAEGYRLYRKSNSGDIDPEDNSGNVNHEYITGNLKCIEISDGSVDSYSDYLQLGTYTYWLTAVNENGEGPESSKVVVEIGESNKAAEEPDAPIEFTGESIFVSAIKLGWTDNSANESGFIIERRNEDGEWEEIFTTVYDVTEFIVRGLKPGTVYQYRIKAVNSAGESDYVECQVLTEGIADISWQVISASQVKVTWKAVQNATYKVELMDMEANVLAEQSSNNNYCYFVRLEPDTEYRVTITAIIGGEEKCSTESDIIRTSADPKGGLF